VNPGRFGKMAKAGREGADSMASGNGNRILNFKEIRRRVSKSNYEILTYQIVFQDKVVGYLFLSPDTYSLVWNGLSQFSFDQPFFFNELLFSHLTVSEIKLVHPYLPKKRHMMDHFYYTHSKTLIILGSENRQVEFDLLDNHQCDIYMEEWVHNPNIVSIMDFARYDSQIVSRGQSYNCCLTAENVTNNEHWEFAVIFSRNLLPRTRALQWIVRNHQMEDQMRTVDFEGSLTALSQILNPQADSVYAID
jgi:hypothetical protein